MSQPLLEGQQSKPSDNFRRMADRIDHNADAVFGGACVILPPANGGTPIEFLLLDQGAVGDVVQFWSTIQSRINLLLSDLKEKSAIQNAFGQRR